MPGSFCLAPVRTTTPSKGFAVGAAQVAADTDD
jgi:hypothetical protein